MVEHLVLFKCNDQVTTEKENELVTKLLSFKEAIPGIIQLTAGVNVTKETDKAQGYRLGLRVTFENQQALDEYGPHPVHQEFVQMLSGLIDDVIVVDYQITGSE